MCCEGLAGEYVQDSEPCWARSKLLLYKGSQSSWFSCVLSYEVGLSAWGGDEKWIVETLVFIFFNCLWTIMNGFSVLDLRIFKTNVIQEKLEAITWIRVLQAAWRRSSIYKPPPHPGKVMWTSGWHLSNMWEQLTDLVDPQPGHSFPWEGSLSSIRGLNVKPRGARSEKEPHHSAIRLVQVGAWVIQASRLEEVTNQ